MTTTASGGGVNVVKLLRAFQSHIGPRRPMDEDDARTWDEIERAISALSRGEPVAWMDAKGETARADLVDWFRANYGEKSEVVARFTTPLFTHPNAARGVEWDQGSPCVKPRPVGMVYPPKPAPRASGYLPDGSGVEWNAYDTAQMEAYARDAVAMYYPAALTALESSRARGDWVLVPREPTDAMLDAWFNAPRRYDACGEVEKWSGPYSAMLAASPTPSPEAAGGDAADKKPAHEFFVYPDDLHPNTVNLVARFATALAEKLWRSERKYGYSDGWADHGWMEECREKLLEHVAKGDPRDVAAYCAFLWHHGERTAPAPQEGGREDALDAARYRFIRDNSNTVNPHIQEMWARCITAYPSPEEWDYAIDAALAAHQQRGKE